MISSIRRKCQAFIGVIGLSVLLLLLFLHFIVLVLDVCIYCMDKLCCLFEVVPLAQEFILQCGPVWPEMESVFLIEGAELQDVL